MMMYGICLTIHDNAVTGTLTNTVVKLIISADYTS